VDSEYDGMFIECVWIWSECDGMSRECREYEWVSRDGECSGISECDVISIGGRVYNSE
jgi:hypothetical protein